jgi:hypothetical protein
MAEGRDWWDKSEILAKIASAIILPLVLLLINHTISTNEARRQELQSKAEKNRQIAESQANRLPVFIDFLSSDSPKKVALTAKVLPYLAATKQLPNDVIPLLIEIDNSQTADQAKRSDSARAALQALAKANPELRQAISKSLTTDLFIQIASSAQLDLAQQVKARLIEKGFRVPGIENVGEARSPLEQAEIRYFEDDTKVQADAVYSLFNQMGIKSSLKLVSGYGKLKHLEVWFPRATR